MAKIIVKWSHLGMLRLKGILTFYKEQNGNATFSRGLRKKIFECIKPLKSQSRLGKLDEKLSTDIYEVRFLIEGHYKIIYTVERENLILILDVYDTRRGGQ